MTVTAVRCTYCSARKRTDPADLPAIERYISTRIARLYAAGPMLILSGTYGLLAPDDPIPWYDHLLTHDEVTTMAERVSTQLVSRGIQSIEFHTADPDTEPQILPYVSTMQLACRQAGVQLCVVILSGPQD